MTPLLPAYAGNPLTYNSFFAGIEGFGLGFERAGMKCIAQVERDPAARSVLERHFPHAYRGVTDVRDVSRTSFPTADVFCGGFPCQDVSVAGRRKGLAGERSGLWFEFRRILDEFKPQWVVIENVPGLLSSNKGADFAEIVRGLVELRYGVCWRILDAQYFGVAQRRRRVFIVGHLGDGRAAEVLFEREGGAWDIAPSRAKGQGTAADAAYCLRNGGRDSDQRDNRTGIGLETDLAYTLQGEQHHSVLAANAFRIRGFGDYTEDDAASSLKARDGKDATDLIADAIDVRNLRGNGGVSGTLQAKANGGYSLNYTNPVVHAFDRSKPSWNDDLTGSLRASGSVTEGVNPGKADHWCVAIGVSNQPTPKFGIDVAPSLDAKADGGGRMEAVAFTERTRKDGRNFEAQEELAYALTNPGSGGRTHSRQIATPYAVRRLTPVECERLQGFPDGWTEGQSDSQRYRQLGNAVCVNVSEWIGRRIVAAERNTA